MCVLAVPAQELMKCAHNETARAPLEFMLRCCNLVAHSIDLHNEFIILPDKELPRDHILDLHKVLRAISCSLPEGVRSISGSHN